MLLKYFISGPVLIFSFTFGHATRSVNIDAQANEWITQALAALGGEEVLNQLTGVTYHVPNVYRSRTLMESYSSLRADTTIAVGGNQNISFSFVSPELQQRIDRNFQTSEFWLVNNPTNLPFSFSLVVEDGQDGFACYVRGNNYVFDPVTAIGGYVDAALAEYLVHQSHMFSPKLMSTIKTNNVATSSIISLPGNITMPAVHDRILNLTVILNPQTYLPYIIRSIEDHYIFGRSYHDLIVYNYTSVSGIQFPRRFKTMYNYDSLLEDFIVTDIDVNPKFVPGFFQGLNASQSPTPKAAPARIAGYGHAEIGEYSFNRIWGGEYTGTLANLSATRPDPSLPNVWHLQFLDSPLWQQMVMEFEHGVLVVDAPPHQNQLVIKWVQDTLKKPITHFWPTHHHHDHTYAAKDFVEIGAKIITPKVALPYWSYIPGAQLEVFDHEPFVYKDDTLQARFHWSREGVHSDDFTYATITKANPGYNDSMVIIEADAWSPGVVDFEFDQGEALDWVRQVVGDGVAKSAIVWPIHGSPTPLTELLELTGYEYPNYTVCDMKSGPALC